MSMMYNAGVCAFWMTQFMYIHMCTCPCTNVCAKPRIIDVGIILLAIDWGHCSDTSMEPRFPPIFLHPLTSLHSVTLLSFSFTSSLTHSEPMVSLFTLYSSLSFPPSLPPSLPHPSIPCTLPSPSIHNSALFLSSPSPVRHYADLVRAPSHADKEGDYIILRTAQSCTGYGGLWMTGEGSSASSDTSQPYEEYTTTRMSKN